MVCYVNNSPQETSDSQTLTQLLAGLALAEQRGLAVAVNDEVVPRAAWAAHELREHDRVTIIRATQGG
ncbi:sulfur carrier protein ThiS [Hymenobacter properus]|uniref:Sulfur carrier protein ThiS n=1 Tax=Hymenobacter properus TaxID=2791026 RepID=A0A931BCP4_9BACT|nr:sulfur carrier protein ThiS [Hymenobacter properus]MBF9141425.1 sulfur carrier protein ThiS [Hymenobacter properus]MBR7720234.1 sulfur carrier protein ThiS [Microvirga sp. SRT04]